MIILDNTPLLTREVPIDQYMFFVTAISPWNLDQTLNKTR